MHTYQCGNYLVTVIPAHGEKHRYERERIRELEEELRHHEMKDRRRFEHLEHGYGHGRERHRQRHRGMDHEQEEEDRYEDTYRNRGEWDDRNRRYSYATDSRRSAGRIPYLPPATPRDHEEERSNRSDRGEDYRRSGGVAVDAQPDNRLE